MPNQYWHHACERCDVREGGRACRRCGADGAFAYWSLSMFESAAVYRYVYELNPFGPHRKLASALLESIRIRCVRCAGRTILTVDENTWRTCPECEGTGGVWNRSIEDVEAMRRRVIESWPASAMPWRPTRIIE